MLYIMKDSTIADNLYQDIQLKINKSKTNANIYSVLYYGIRVSLILLAAFITLATAYQEIIKGNYKLFILWLGAITTILTAVDTLYQTESKRNTYKTMLHDFRVLRTDFVFHYTNQTLSEEKRKSLYEEFKRINSLGRELIGNDD